MARHECVTAQRAQRHARARYDEARAAPVKILLLMRGARLMPGALSLTCRDDITRRYALMLIRMLMPGMPLSCAMLLICRYCFTRRCCDAALSIFRRVACCR